MSGQSTSRYLVEVFENYERNCSTDPMVRNKRKIVTRHVYHRPNVEGLPFTGIPRREGVDDYVDTYDAPPAVEAAWEQYKRGVYGMATTVEQIIDHFEYPRTKWVRCPVCRSNARSPRLLDSSWGCSTCGVSVHIHREPYCATERKLFVECGDAMAHLSNYYRSEDPSMQVGSACDVSYKNFAIRFQRFFITYSKVLDRSNLDISYSDGFDVFGCNFPMNMDEVIPVPVPGIDSTLPSPPEG